MVAYNVSNVIKTPDGNPIVGATVLITLKPEGAFRLSDGAEIVSPVMEVTDSLGSWSTLLEDNYNISPVNSYYEIEERVPPAYGGTQIWTIMLQGSGGNLASIWTSQNPWPVVPFDPGGIYYTKSECNDLFLTEFEGDAAYAPITNGDGETTILDGYGSPDVTIGHTGDYYLDKTNHVLYGPRQVNPPYWNVALTGGGLQGPPGPVGPPGPPGSAGTNYTFNQGTPATTWTITHGLGYNPNVTVVDSGGSQVEGDVVYAGTQVILNFTAAFSGVAYLS